MFLELSQNGELLYRMLFTKEFDADRLKEKLDAGIFTVDEINRAAFQYVKDCNGVPAFEECDRYPLGERIPGYESSPLLETIRILLDYGLDPNLVHETGSRDNILSQLRFVMNGYQSADAAAAMFEHGGNPNLVLEYEDNPLIADLAFDVGWFVNGDVESRYVADQFMHYWMTVVGYGARYSDGALPVDTYEDYSFDVWKCGPFDVSAFRNHRQFYFGLLHNDEGKFAGIGFFNKKTNREVARY